MAHDAACGPDHVTEDDAAATLLKKWGDAEDKPLDIELCMKGAEEAKKEAHLDTCPIDTD